MAAAEARGVQKAQELIYYCTFKPFLLKKKVIKFINVGIFSYCIYSEIVWLSNRRRSFMYIKR